MYWNLQSCAKHEKVIGAIALKSSGPLYPKFPKFFRSSFYIRSRPLSNMASNAFLLILQVYSFHYAWEGGSFNIRIRLVPLCSTLHLCLHFNATFQNFFFAEMSYSHCVSFAIRWSFFLVQPLYTERLINRNKTAAQVILSFIFCMFIAIL